MPRHSIPISAIIILALLLAGCSITGKSSSLLEDEILACSLGTDIAFLNINDIVQACHNGNSLYFVVENKGTSRISGLSVRLESGYNVSMLVREDIPPGDLSQNSLDFGDQDLGDAVLRVAPMIGESRLLCTNSVITTEISSC